MINYGYSEKNKTMEKFYKLEAKSTSNSIAYLGSNEISNLIAIEFFNKGIPPEKPIKLRHISGKRWPDFLTRMHVVLPFVSEKFINAIEACGLTGWVKYQIEVENKPKEIKTEYFGLLITGQCENNLKTISKEKKLNNWDGSDFFYMRNTATIFLSEKAFNCLNEKKTKLSNLDLEDFESYLLCHTDSAAYFKKKFNI
jgi:hypothetical protein